MHSIEFEKQSGGKVRKFNNPDSELRMLIDEVSLELKRLFPELKAPCRMSQSREDIRCYKAYSYVLLLDIKKALLSGKLWQMCLALVGLKPGIIFIIPKILKIYAAPSFDDQGVEQGERRNRLKAGFKTSEQLLNILFMLPLKIFNLKGTSQLYVDDLILFSNSSIWLKTFHWGLEKYFSFLGFQFHKIETYDLKTKPPKCGQRLGLYFGFNSSGELVTKVRSRTLRKYMARIKRKKSLDSITDILYGRIAPPTYPLYATFDKSIWTDQIQRKQFFARVAGLLKSRYPELRSFSKQEIAYSLSGHSYNSQPVLEEDLWAGTIGSSSPLVF